jgi:sensor histidine kinase regulating citrate/malate metabolism
MIHISNYCEQAIQISLEEPQTTKQNPEMHGYGIKGMRLAVEKYDGHMNIKQENNWFIVSILIPIPEQKKQALI